MKEMNILYGIDEQKKDYSRYLGVSIMSLLEYNKDENVHIYILTQYLEESNKKELIRIVESYGKKISFSDGNIIPQKFKKILGLNGTQPMATYYRFFFSDFFDIKDRLLYLDCDTIVNKNLSEFYKTDFKGSTFIGNLDLPTTVYIRNKKYGLSNYINAGVFLLDIRSFKKVDLYSEMIKLNEKIGKPQFNDQDYLNFIFKDEIRLYKNLQHFVYLPWGNPKTINSLIIHTMQEPNKGGLSFCPKYIEELFNKYLSKTKRKTYIGFKRKHNIKQILSYIYDFLIVNTITYLSLQIFGVKSTSNLLSFLSKIGTTIRKIFFRK